MVVVDSDSFPPDPETDLKNFHRKEAEKNFQRKQAECEAAYLNTGEPQALVEALRNARGYPQLPTELNWLMVAAGEFIMRSITAQMAERFKERMRHVQRYRCVRDFRRKGHKKELALDLAMAELEATDAKGALPTIRDSYDRVYRDLKRVKHESEYFYLVARSDPTRVPVHVVQLPDGGLAINGVAFRPQGAIVGPAVTPPVTVGPTVWSAGTLSKRLEHCEGHGSFRDEPRAHESATRR
jgi:hypothetical protein